jgi:hypothetical protein
LSYWQLITPHFFNPPRYKEKRYAHVYISLRQFVLVVIFPLNALITEVDVVFVEQKKPLQQLLVAVAALNKWHPMGLPHHTGALKPHHVYGKRW